MRLRIIGVLVIAAMVQVASWCQQAAENATQPESAGQDATAMAHTVNPPKVECHGNTLSISANYSRLGAILTEIQKCTGVKFDAPETAKSYLVFDEIGPASSSDVLTSLLSESGFDYVIGASEADPGKIEKIVLLTRTDDKDATSAGQRGSSPQRRAFSQMREAARPKTPEEQLAAAAEADKGGDDSSGPSQSAPAVPESTSGPGKLDTSATKAGADATATNAEAPPAPDAATAAKPADDASAANTDATPSQPAQETASPARPLSPSDERIANMEKLFEQRRQMQQQQAPQQTQPQHPAPQ